MAHKLPDVVRTALVLPDTPPVDPSESSGRGLASPRRPQPYSISGGWGRGSQTTRHFPSGTDRDTLVAHTQLERQHDAPDFSPSPVASTNQQQPTERNYAGGQPACPQTTQTDPAAPFPTPFS